MWFVTKSKPYLREQVWQHAVRAIRLGQITFKTVYNKEIVTMSTRVLKGCRANGITNSTKKRFHKLVDKLKSSASDPNLWGEAKRKGRTISETDIEGKDSILSKSSRRTSPKLT